MVEANPANTKLSVADISAFVRDKRDLYNLALRNGFYLPKYTSQAITEEYLVEILRGTYWCPKLVDIRMLPCVKAPSKDILLAKFREATLLHDKNLVYVDHKHQPDSKWLVDVIATLMPWDEMFQRGYVPPPRKPRLNDLKVIEMPAGVFEGVPATKSKAKARRLRILGDAMTDARLERLQAVQQEIAGQIHLQSMVKADKAKRKKCLRVEQKPLTEEEKRTGSEIKDKFFHPTPFLKQGGGMLASDVGGIIGSLRHSGAGSGPQDSPREAAVVNSLGISQGSGSRRK